MREISRCMRERRKKKKCIISTSGFGWKCNNQNTMRNAILQFLAQLKPGSTKNVKGDLNFAKCLPWWLVQTASDKLQRSIVPELENVMFAHR